MAGSGRPFVSRPRLECDIGARGELCDGLGIARRTDGEETTGYSKAVIVTINDAWGAKEGLPWN